MVRRHVKSDFAADVYVFPGGKVDPGDSDPELLELLDFHPLPAARREESERWKAVRVAAIRELFEEAGVLLATRRGAIVDLVGDQAEAFDRYRRQLQAGAITLGDIARSEDLRLLGDSLHPFSRWITPEPFPRRFDTRFFVAEMPDRQLPIHDREETTASAWVSPGDALRRYRTGEFPLVFATEAHLRRMAEFRSIEEMMAATETADLEPVTPRVIQVSGEQHFLLPGDEGYENRGDPH
jgi:8-oxo-dGTP pyrophosphatase MutT (NUDIX family)